MRRLTLDYLRTESGSGLVLAASALAAIGLANSGYAGHCQAALDAPAPVRVGAFAETLTVGGWVRTLLMPVFFLVTGMELKFELLRGELSNPRRLALPALAAIGGLVGPLLLYLAINHAAIGAHTPWTAGLATDGAAALAAMAVAGPRVSHMSRILLVSIAATDNLAGALLAAISGSVHIGLPMLAEAGAFLAALVLLSRWRRAPFLLYALGIVGVWVFTLQSGLDTAVAGIACAFAIPVGARRPGQESTLKYFMESLHPYVAFAILPLFVLTAAGIPLRSFRPGELGAPTSLGVALALMVGKPIGVFGFCAAATGLKWVRMPAGARWDELLVVALLSGIGFSVSLYLAGADAPPTIRAAVLAGSFGALMASWALLAWMERAPAPAAA